MRESVRRGIPPQEADRRSVPTPMIDLPLRDGDGLREQSAGVRRVQSAGELELKDRGASSRQGQLSGWWTQGGGVREGGSRATLRGRAMTDKQRVAGVRNGRVEHRSFDGADVVLLRN